MAEWFRGDAGERGKVGDHGQDGRQGEQGEQGEQGPPGKSPEDIEVDRDVREALALALSEKTREKDDEVDRRLHVADRRLLWTYALVAFALIVYSYVDERGDREFERSVSALCQQDNDDSARFNAVVDRLAQAAATNPSRTPQQRLDLANDLRSLRQTLAECPPG